MSCMVYAIRVFLAYMYLSHEFYLWPFFRQSVGAVICACRFLVGGPRGTFPWARVAFGWALWLRTGLLEPNLPHVTVRGCWAGSGVLSVPAGGCRVDRCRVFRGCGLLNLQTCECAQRHVLFFVFYYVSLYLYPESWLYMYVLLYLYPEGLLYL